MIIFKKLNYFFATLVIFTYIIIGTIPYKYNFDAKMLGTSAIFLICIPFFLHLIYSLISKKFTRKDKIINIFIFVLILPLGAMIGNIAWKIHFENYWSNNSAKYSKLATEILEYKKITSLNNYDFTSLKGIRIPFIVINEQRFIKDDEKIAEVLKQKGIEKEKYSYFQDKMKELYVERIEAKETNIYFYIEDFISEYFSGIAYSPTSKKIKTKYGEILVWEEIEKNWYKFELN